MLAIMAIIWNSRCGPAVWTSADASYSAIRNSFGVRTCKRSKRAGVRFACPGQFSSRGAGCTNGGLFFVVDTSERCGAGYRGPQASSRLAEGASIKISDSKGRVVLLNFWATCCGPCKIEIPWCVEFQIKYKDRGLAVPFVSVDEGVWETVRPIIIAHNMNYRVASATDQVARHYGGIGSLPTTSIIDQEGKIAAVHIGLVSKTNYVSQILHLLATHDSAAPIGPQARPNCKYVN